MGASNFSIAMGYLLQRVHRTTSHVSAAESITNPPATSLPAQRRPSIGCVDDAALLADDLTNGADEHVYRLATRHGILIIEHHGRHRAHTA